MAAFLANAMFAGDLAANATVSGQRVTVDDELLTATLRSALQTLGPLAFGPDVTSGAKVAMHVSDLELNPVDDGSPNANGVLSFSVTSDPGDGVRTAAASVPVRCTPIPAP